MTKKTIFILLLLFVAVISSYAQQGTNSGTHFFLTFGKNRLHSKIDSTYNPSLNKYVYDVELMLRITALEQSEVRFHFRNDSTLDKTITVNSGVIFDYKFSLREMKAIYSTGQTNQTSARDWRSLEITAVKPISMVAMSSASASVEATLVFPVEVLGTEYLHAGMTPNGEKHSNGYVIVATEDGTVVTHNTPLFYVGTFTTNLSKGEVYQYCYTGQMNNNPSGTMIVSNKPIAFFQNTTEATVSNSENYSFEQIPPVNQWGTNFVLPTEYNVLTDRYSGFARVYSKNRNTDTIRGTVIYSDGTTSLFTIKPASGVASETCYDISMTATINTSANACYITTDKPVGVCAYGINRGILNDLAQPASAWLPPVEQRTRNVIISPLDFNGTHVYIPMWHYFTIITPTATKNNTTIAFGGYAPQLVTMLNDTTFQWIADNVGGSGYSVGLGYFGKSNAAAQPPEFLRMIAVADNPAGVIALAYGQGSYTNYYYSVGSGIYNLLNKLDITTHPSTASVSKCQNTGDFPILSVTATDAVATYQWYKNSVNSNSGGTAISGETSSTYSPPSTSAGRFYYYCVVSRIFDSVTSNVSGEHTVNSSVTPTVSISGDTVISAGTNATFKATPTHGGNSPSFQWKKNGVNLGTNSNIYQDNTLSNGDKITCVLTSNSDCATPATATSNILTISIPVNSSTTSGTVFPFVHHITTNGIPDTTFNELFPITAELYATPATGTTDDPIGIILNTDPLYTTKVKYYDGNVWYPGIPKYPGEILQTNNPGIPVHWDELVEPSLIEAVDNAELAEGELPNVPVGIYSFQDVPDGNYILVLSRVGYVTRFSEVCITSASGHLGHRELILGDINGNMQVGNADASEIKPNFAVLGSPNYKVKYDVNADGKIDSQDLLHIRKVLGFSIVHYSDTRIWLLKY